MALTRQSIVRGPGCVYWTPGSSAVALPSVGPIEAEAVVKETPVQTALSGKIDDRFGGAEARISWTPLGILSDAILAVLFPNAYRNPVIGSSIFGSTDVPVRIHSVAGQKLDFTACALTKMPQIILSGDKQIYGPAEISAVRGNGLEWANAAALYTPIVAGTFAAPSAANSTIPMAAATAAWGSLIASIITEGGWTIDSTISTSDDSVDGYGVNDKILTGVSVIAKCKPKNLNESLLDKLYLQGTGISVGMSRRRSANLVLTVPNTLTVTLYDATIARGPLRWAGVDIRAGEIAFGAQRAESTGAYGALFDISIYVAPPG